MSDIDGILEIWCLNGLYSRRHDLGPKLPRGYVRPNMAVYEDLIRRLPNNTSLCTGRTVCRGRRDATVFLSQISVSNVRFT